MPTSPEFSRLPDVQPPPGLFENVLTAIHEARMRSLRLRLAGALAATMASVAFVTSNWTALRLEFGQSSFFSLLRLLFSDPDIAFWNVKDFSLSLLEAIPIASVLALLFVAFTGVMVTAFVSALWNERHATYITHLA